MCAAAEDDGVAALGIGGVDEDPGGGLTELDGVACVQLVDRVAVVEGQAPESFRYLENPSCNDLYRTGITFADGVVLGDPEIDPQVMQYLEGLDKPVLPYQSPASENFSENHYEFYQSLLEQSVLETKK